jgi:hypothetical protein
VRIDPKLYRKHVQLENGKQVLYVELKKALYGTLEGGVTVLAAVIFTTDRMGLHPQPIRIVRDEQNHQRITNVPSCGTLTTSKISHADPEVVTEVIDLLEGEFGKEAPLTKTRGHVHDYLGDDDRLLNALERFASQ